MRKFLFFTIPALLAVLPFSCSNEGFKDPKLGKAAEESTAEKVACVVGDVCREISINACVIIGGEQKPEGETCKKSYIDTTGFDYEIVGDLLHIKGEVKIIEGSDKTLDSIVIVANFPVAPILNVGDKIYDFAEVPPIDLKRDDIPCAGNRIYVIIYAGGEPDGQTLHEKKFDKPKSICKDDYPIVFSCGWNLPEQDYGKKITPYLTLAAKADTANCRMEMRKSTDTTVKFKLDSAYAILSSSGFIRDSINVEFLTEGFVICEDSTRKGSLRNDCGSLTIKLVPAPVISAGGLVLKGNYKSGDSVYFYSGVKVSDSASAETIVIDDSYMCDSIAIDIEPSTALTPNGTTLDPAAPTPISISVIATCNGVPYTIIDTTATVVPDPKIGDCSLESGWDSLMYKKIDYKKYQGASKVSQATILDRVQSEGESLTINASVENSYGRCAAIEYSLTGRSGSFGSNNTILLSTLSSSSSGKTTLDSITARITCSGIQTRKVCSEKITVVEKYAKIEKCDDPRITVGPGTTLLEIDCYGDGDPTNLPKNLGCDCADEDYGGCGAAGTTYACASGTYNNPNNFFSLNGTKAGGGGCWATIELPANTVRDKKRVLVEYYKEIGCVAHW